MDEPRPGLANKTVPWDPPGFSHLLAAGVRTEMGMLQHGCLLDPESACGEDALESSTESALNFEWEAGLCCGKLLGPHH